MLWRNNRTHSYSIDPYYSGLLQQFPALYQIFISQSGRMVFQHTNQSAREGLASVLFRGVLRSWTGLFAGPPETFKDRIGGRSNIRSATKSILAILVGIAFQDRLLSSLDQTLGELLPEEFTPDMDPAKRQISLRHLLTMTSRLASMESGVPAFRMLASRDWTRFMLRLPLVSQPGTRFLYNSANPHLVSAILSRLSGESLLDYANRKLFRSLGIRGVVWGSDPMGTTFGGGNLFLSAEELLRIGELCLHRGKLNGNQIVPEKWFDEMWQPYQEYYPGWNYGYYWYLHDEVHFQTGKNYVTYSAAGSGGQKLLLIPELDLVLSVVAATDFIGERGMALNQFISTHLIAAVENTTERFR